VPALIIGNGESRKNLDLSPYLKSFISVGCNAIHRDYITDHLVCCDQKMAQESLQNPNLTSTKIYTRQRWMNTNLRYMGNLNPLPDLPVNGDTKPDDDFNWGSGPYAVLLGCHLSSEVVLLGFDLYSNDDLVNNVYKGTANYSREDSHSVDPAFWIYQISRLFDHFQNHNFICLNHDSWTPPDSWRKGNVRFRDHNYLDRVLDIVNNSIVQ